MDRFVVMVDAGYLLRQSIEIVSGRQSKKRHQLDITDPAQLVALLISKSRHALNLGNRELLRVYWYDGVMNGGVTQQQRAIMELPDVHFRGGTVNSAGQQKGVDSLIVTDLIELAANHAISDAALVTGDSDLAVGIELSQKKGVRIAVIGLEDFSVGVSHNQSFEVTSRADRVYRLGAADISPVMRYVVPASAASTTGNDAATEKTDGNNKPTASEGRKPEDMAILPSSAVATAPRQLDEQGKHEIQEMVAQFIEQQASLVSAVDPGTKRIESVVDRALIHHVFSRLSRGALTSQEKNFARQCFRQKLGF